MSEQSDELVRRVLKADPTPASFDDNVRYLRQRGGSGRAAAKLAGVSESSFRRWQRGTRPKPATVQKLAEAVRSMRSRPSTMGDAGVMLPVVSNDRKRGSRERDISGRQLKLAEGTLAKMHSTWIATGDSEAVARVFVAGIGEPWYKAKLGRALRTSSGRSAGRGASSGGGGTGGGASGGGGGSGGSGGGGGGDDDDLDSDPDDDGYDDDDEYDGADEYDGGDDYVDDYGMSIG